MGQGTALIWFFGLIIVLFIIVVVIAIIGFTRTKRPVSGVGHGGPVIDERQQPIAERLGEDRPKEFGDDPRGEDVGGNFSAALPQDDKDRQSQ